MKKRLFLWGNIFLLVICFCSAMIFFNYWMLPSYKIERVAQKTKDFDLKEDLLAYAAILKKAQNGPIDLEEANEGLFYSILLGYSEYGQDFIDKGANVNFRGARLLNVALAKNKYESIKFLFDNHIEFKQEILLESICGFEGLTKKDKVERLKIVEYFLERKFTISLEENFDRVVSALENEIELRTLFKHYFIDKVWQDLLKALDGDIEAQMKIGIFCIEKLRKNEEGFYWIKKSAGTGTPRATILLAKCYEKGIGVQKNLREAFELYKSAAEKGDAIAQYKLGECYEYGKGCSENISLAIDWYKKSSFQNFLKAKIKLKELPSEIIVDNAFSNDAECQYELAMWFLKERRDESVVYYWLEEATKRGSVNAMLFLGEKYLKEDERKEEGVRLLKKAAKSKNKKAMYLLGTYYLDNNIDFDKGIDLLNQAAKKQCEKSRERLNSMKNVSLVSIPKSNYSIGKYEVTNQEYFLVMGNPDFDFNDFKFYPVVNVSYNEAKEYCRRLTRLGRMLGSIYEKQEYRLPTSDEWEYACCAGAKTRFCGGDSDKVLKRYAWYGENSDYKIHRAGTKSPNKWEIYDMHGNVWEWCLDTDKKFLNNIRRGGSAFTTAEACGSFYFNNSNGPDFKYEDIGFRIVLANTISENNRNISKKSEKIEAVLVVEETSVLNALKKIRNQMIPITNKDYQIGKYEVSQDEYEEIMKNNPSEFRGRNRPVENVSWNDAVDFCKKLTKLSHIANTIPENYEYRLPTSEEWEYVCRAGTMEYPSYASSENLNKYAQYGGMMITCNVGEKAPNKWGVYDMYGNVWEWCGDWRGSNPVSKGGSFKSSAKFCDASNVNKGRENTKSSEIGFRVLFAPKK